MEQPPLGQRRQRRVGHATGPFERRHGVDPGGDAVGQDPQQAGVIVDVGGPGEGGEQRTEAVDGEDDRLARRRRIRLPTRQFDGEEADESDPPLGVVEADDGSAVGQFGDRFEGVLTAGVDDVAVRLGAGSGDQRAQGRRLARAEATDQRQVAFVAPPAQGDLPLPCGVVDESDGAGLEAR